MLEIKKAEFVRSAYTFSQPPVLPPLPQVAMVGRSNVGKSSLINAVCNRKALAKTSATPGKTRSVNYYNLNDALFLVDLPGYGYAGVSKKEKEGWGEMMDGYFSTAQELRHLLLLMDIRRTPNDDDRQMAWYLQHYGIPCTIVATKCDKVSRSQRTTAAAKLSDALGMTFRTKTICFSTLDRIGRAEVLQVLGSVLQEK